MPPAETSVLTAEHLEHWPESLNDPKPAPGQSVEAAVNFAIASYRWWCYLEGLPLPTAAAIRAHMRRQDP